MSTTRIPVRLHMHPYSVYVGTSLLNRLPSLMRAARLGSRAVLVADARLRRGPAAKLAAKLKRAGITADLYTLPAGESAKSLSALNQLYAFLLKKRVERRTPLIALGGGTVGDAAGFAAATYHRGIPLIHAPTTLLAQVDSAIGGKTAANLPGAKNAIGAFYQPLFVVADTDILSTLPKKEFLAGMAEVVKYALVFDRNFARTLLRDWKKIVSGENNARTDMIRRCIEHKARIVAQDERDLSGQREVLNFGHTLGHALESSTGYGRFRHGEAVAWGMRAAIALSENRGWLNAADCVLAHQLLSLLPAPRWPESLTHARIHAALRTDKKVVGSKNTFVLLKRLADPVRVRDVSRAEVLAALKEIA